MNGLALDTATRNDPGPLFKLAEQWFSDQKITINVDVIWIYLRALVYRGDGTKQNILNLRPISQSLVHRDRPRRGGPDYRVRADQFGDRRVHDLERHVDLGRGDVLVLHLGFGEGRLLHR